MNSRHCSTLIVGAGPGGYALAAAEVAAGKDVVVIEDSRLGGTCLNRGCIPTKCLCASASALAAARSAARLGVAGCDKVSLDIDAARLHKNTVVSSLRDDVASLLASCTIVNSRAAFDDNGHIVAADTVFSADRVVIATGSAPASLPIPGAELCVSSDALLELDSVPASLCVIGGGVIGLELASAYADFGSQVTVIEFLPEILPGFDTDIARRLRSMLQRRGIRIVTSAAASSISLSDDNSRTVTYTTRGKEQTVAADCVLMAVGRRPVVPDNYAAAGISLDPKGRIITDSSFLAAPGIYAIGDCAAGFPMLAHVAEAQAHILAGHSADLLRAIPSVIYTRPEAFAVGMTEADASRAGIDIAVRKIPVAANSYARAIAAADGLVKIVAEAASGLLLGIHYVGPAADTLVGEAQLTVASRLTVSDLLGTIHAHPTLTELFPAALPR